MQRKQTDITTALSKPTKNRPANRTAAILYFGILLASCGGGSGGINPGSTIVSATTNQAPTNFNGALNGRVISSHSNEQIDLQTGQVNFILGESPAPRMDGKEYAYFVQDHRFLPTPNACSANNWFSRIIIRDTATGLAQSSFEIAQTIYGSVRLSPDGQTMAFDWWNVLNCGDEARLAIFSRYGEEIIRGNGKIGSFDWLPDNRLVFTTDSKIVVETERNSLEWLEVFDYSDMPGYASRLAVSPDGRKILFEMVTGTPPTFATVSYRYATIWQVNIDGTGLKKLVDSRRGDNQYEERINSPVWSPDGSHILATEGYLSGASISALTLPGPVLDTVIDSTVIPVSGSGITHVFPSSANAVELPPVSYSPNAVRPLFTLENGSVYTAALSINGGQHWVPAVQSPATVPGFLSPPNGQVNRGLQGTLYRINKQQKLEAMALATGQVSEIYTLDEEASSYSDLSADATRFVDWRYEFDDPRLVILQENGTEFRNYVLQTNDYHYSPESGFRFSPVNRDHLAWVYDDDNFGTGVIVLDIETGNFLGDFNNRNYTSNGWMPNGDLLLTEVGTVYRSRLVNGKFTAPEKLFEHTEGIYFPSVNPIDNRLLFSAGNQVLTVNLDGGDTTVKTLRTFGAISAPAWSPDGRYIVAWRSGRPVIFAEDSEYLRYFDASNSPGILLVGEGTSVDWSDSQTKFYWR